MVGLEPLAILYIQSNKRIFEKSPRNPSKFGGCYHKNGIIYLLQRAGMDLYASWGGIPFSPANNIGFPP